MAQTAEQLAAQQKQQADHVRDLMAQQNAARASGKPQTYPSAQEIDKMVNDRQQVSDDLARLTQQMRNAARELAPTQPAASGKLRSALEGMDENDLGTRMQRSSDRLRSGEFSDQEETALTSDLQKLGQQVGDAARAVGSAQHASKDAELNRAMDDLSRLRDQLAGLGGQPNPQAGQRQPGRSAQRRPGPAPANRATANPVSPVSNGQHGQPGQPGQGKQGGQGQAVKPARSGQGNRLAGPVGNPAGGAGQSRSQWRYGDLTTPAIPASPVRPWRRNRSQPRPIPSARLTRD